MTTHPPPRLAALAVSLALTACGDTSGSSGAGSSGADSTGAESSGAASTESTGGPPVTCGAPGDEASTDEQIAALEGCDVYLGALMLLSNVSSVAPLASLRVLEGEIFLGGTDSPLTTLAGLEQLESVGEVILNAHNISDLLSLQSLREVKGDFTVANMFSLVDLRGLESLRVVEGNFVLLANPMLTSVEGLEGLEEVKGDFEALSVMTPLPRADLQALIDRIQIGGMINID